MRIEARIANIEMKDEAEAIFNLFLESVFPPRSSNVCQTEEMLPAVNPEEMWRF